MKKILVTGANGQLGNELRDIAPDYPVAEFVFTDVEELDITDYNAIDNLCRVHGFDFIINCAAYTAVDKAETEKEAAFKINAEAAGNLARNAFEYKIKLVHISTDYVFDGSANIPYNEESAVCPQSVYGDSKLKGEQEILSSGAEAVIVRTSWLYSAYGRNFVKTMLRLGKEFREVNVVFDQAGTPTCAADLAKAIMCIVSVEPENFKPGIYHYSNEGVCSWYDFALEVFHLSGIGCKVNPILSEAFPTEAKRPAYSVLDKARIRKTFGISIPYWRDSLEKCLKRMSSRGVS